MADLKNSFKNKVIRKLKSGTWYPFYNTFYEKVPIDPREYLRFQKRDFPGKQYLRLLTELSRLDIAPGIPKSPGSSEELP